EAGPAHDLAPMEGVVRQLAVMPGDMVARGQRLYVLEAMKMQIQVCATAPGRVVALHAGLGERVVSGQQILTFESQTPDGDEEC
ncbi:MAG: 3-methylcrotonyl-CoA carboxylase, partial [Candidatus Melainabacteria bacterium HGW-Melainabacteria-1]